MFGRDRQTEREIVKLRVEIERLRSDRKEAIRAIVYRIMHERSTLGDRMTLPEWEKFIADQLGRREEP